MPKISTVQCGSLGRFIEIVRELRSINPTKNVWYRGHGRQAYELRPSLFRNEKYSTIEEVNKIERTMLNEYEFGLPSFETAKTTEQWDRLFLMQHYRMPTRLLDWSSSPLVAAFFALKTTPPVQEKAVIWAMHPDIWNKYMVPDIATTQKIYNTKDSFLNQYHPDTTSQNRLVPIAMEGTLSNPRVNAQKGKFVIFGNSMDTMEDHARRQLPNNEKVLTKIIIPRAKCEDFFSELTHLGITHGTVFPDLEGFANEITFRHGF